MILDVCCSLTAAPLVNAQHYEDAKDIVLDLLGYGVPPEYLATIGVSREIIFYVFTELHLRLPTNLDITGLVPFHQPPPEPIQVSSPAIQTRPQRSNSSSVPSSSMPSSSMPPPPSIPSRHETSSRVTHPSLPQKPPTPQVNPPTSPVPRPSSASTTQLSVLTPAYDLQVSSVPRPSSTPTTQLSVLTTAYDLQVTKLTVANTNLHEIEQQRRQELIARKAVQASRKNKANSTNAVGPSSSSSSPSVVSPAVIDSTLRNADMTSPVPAASVDDFLKSIGSVSGTEQGTGTTGSPIHMEDPLIQYRRHASPESMEVDESDEIPGFLTGHGDTPLSRPLSAHSIPDESLSHASTTSGAPTDPPSSTSSTSGFHEAVPGDLGGRDYMKEDIPPGDDHFQHIESTRRGVKRPVASDFVDFEGGPPPRPYSTNGYSSGSGGSQPPSMRRKTTGGFASVSGMRRCVIDLSDSEDEGDGDLQRSEGDSRQRHYSPLPFRGLAMPTSMPHIANGGDGVPSHHHSNSNSGVQSPADLQAKEEEIRKMREMIAQREQSRLRKLAVVC